MGVLDGTGLKKLQENLLSKGDQNKIKGLKLTKNIIVACDIYYRTKNEGIKKLIEWAEDGQINVKGISRKQFMKSIENLPKEENKTFGGEKK